MRPITSDYFVSSYYKDGSIVLKFEGTTLSIVNIPKVFNYRKIFVDIVDHCDVVIYSGVIVQQLDAINISLPTDGIFFLRFFFEVSNGFEAFLFRRDVPIYKNRNKIIFINTIIHKSNKIFYENLPQPSNNFLKRKRTSLKTLANFITKDCKSNYDRILKIHDWIATELYYDYDLLNIDKSQWNVDPLYVLNNRRSVCQGYTNLSISMMNCIGIPALGITCFTLEDSDNMGWANPFNITAGSSHIITAAWDQRWILMDITWDSHNYYKNGTYEPPQSISHKYFDATLAFISNTHRLISVEY